MLPTFSISPFPNKPFSPNQVPTSRKIFPKFEPKTRTVRCSKPYSADEIDQNTLLSKKALPLPSHVEIITSTANPFVKHCIKLRESSSYRHSHGSVLLVGSSPIREVCSSQRTFKYEPSMIECLVLLDNVNVPKDLVSYHTRRVHVSPVVMKKLSGLQSVESVDMAAVLRIPYAFQNSGQNLLEEDYLKIFPLVQRILVLEGIQDPGNLGALLRSALAFRWNGVFLLSGCCDPFNDKALRASRGASFQLPIVSGEWADLAAMKREYGMRMVAGHPASSGQLKPVLPLSRALADSLASTPVCLVLGSEGGGLSERSRQDCELISIPMTGNFESLNVSVAGGIFLYMLQPENHDVG